MPHPDSFFKGIREDNTVDDYPIETHYLPCSSIADDEGFMRVVVEADGYDIETRIAHDTLFAAGWVKAGTGGSVEGHALLLVDRPGQIGATPKGTGAGIKPSTPLSASSPAGDKSTHMPAVLGGIAGVAEPKRCKECNATGLWHCQHPDECGGPWDKKHDASGVPGAEGGQQ